MLLTEQEIQDMKIEDWDILDGLKTEDDIIDYLATAFEEPADKEYIRHALETAVKAANALGICNSSEKETVAAMAQ